MNLVVVTPHFAPDVAPTGEVVTRLTEELALRGHTIEVVTSLPWYREHRVDPEFEGRLIRYEDTPWGRITRLHPFPTADKRNIVGRAAAFAAFSALAGAVGSRGSNVEGVLAVSPPLTLGMTGWLIARARDGAFVFNVQDVYPDVAVELEVVRSRAFIAAASVLERLCYRQAHAITVLSEDMRTNVSSKVPTAKVEVIPNFVDTNWIRPLPRENSYRREFGLEGKTIVMYAGNVGLSQSLELMLQAAAALAYDPDLVFAINGQGAARADLERRARGLSNVRFFDMQPSERLPEVIAAADLHVVPLKRGLARTSIPSKTYSIFAGARPVLASVDEDSELARMVQASGAGKTVPPDDPEAFAKAVRELLESPEEARQMGRRGRAFVLERASPSAVAQAYEALFHRLRPLRCSHSSAPRGPSAGGRGAALW